MDNDNHANYVIRYEIFDYALEWYMRFNNLQEHHIVEISMEIPNVLDEFERINGFLRTAYVLKQISSSDWTAFAKVTAMIRDEILAGLAEIMVKKQY